VGSGWCRPSRSRCGSRDRLSDLYRWYADDAVRLAYLITRDRGLAEDLVRDAFVTSRPGGVGGRRGTYGHVGRYDILIAAPPTIPSGRVPGDVAREALLEVAEAAEVLLHLRCGRSSP
jgi:hypothetical protein